jgi:hypothetical protein
LIPKEAGPGDRFNIDQTPKPMDIKTTTTRAVLTVFTLALHGRYDGI